jgi:hypothetical protein
MPGAACAGPGAQQSGRAEIASVGTDEDGERGEVGGPDHPEVQQYDAPDAARTCTAQEGDRTRSGSRVSAQALWAGCAPRRRDVPLSDGGGAVAPGLLPSRRESGRGRIVRRPAVPYSIQERSWQRLIPQ